MENTKHLINVNKVYVDFFSQEEWTDEVMKSSYFSYLNLTGILKNPLYGIPKEEAFNIMDNFSYAISTCFSNGYNYVLDRGMTKEGINETYFFLNAVVLEA